jgi:hypothetical protein
MILSLIIRITYLAFGRRHYYSTLLMCKQPWVIHLMYNLRYMSQKLTIPQLNRKKHLLCRLVLTVNHNLTTEKNLYHFRKNPNFQTLYVANKNLVVIFVWCTRCNKMSVNYVLYFNINYKSYLFSIFRLFLIFITISDIQNSFSYFL